MKTKMNPISLFILLFTLKKDILAERHEPHLHPEVKIVGYTGPLTSDILRLFRGAEYIEFINCNFTAVPAKIYTELQNLKRIYFENITSVQVHDNVGEDANTLEEFYFILSTWDDPDLSGWNNFHNLKKLVITSHTIPFVELKANSLNETSLEHLEISDSGVEKIDDLTFNNLAKLKTLVLSKNKIKTITKEMLTPLKSLEKLDLHGNLLESFETSQLPELPQLKSINLSQNPLKSLSLSGVEKVAPKLEKVDLRDALITREELVELRKNSDVRFIM